MKKSKAFESFLILEDLIQDPDKRFSKVKYRRYRTSDPDRVIISTASSGHFLDVYGSPGVSAWDKAGNIIDALNDDLRRQINDEKGH